MNELLKPCPFCGNRAEISEVLNERGRRLKYKVFCTNIHCSAEMTCWAKEGYRYVNPTPRQEKFKYSRERYCIKMRDELIEKWNRREEHE